MVFNNTTIDKMGCRKPTWTKCAINFTWFALPDTLGVGEIGISAFRMGNHCSFKIPLIAL